jgi:hypothetical protein
MREEGCSPADAEVLLASLPDRFVEAAREPVGAASSDFDSGTGE